MKRLSRLLVLLASLPLLFCGCRNVGDMVVSGLHVELKSITRGADGATTAEFVLVNPNVVSYLVAGVDAKVYLNGTFVGTVGAHTPIGLPAQQQITQGAALAPAGAAAARILDEAAQAGSASYRLDTMLDIQMVGTKHERGEVSHSGTVAVSGK